MCPSVHYLLTLKYTIRIIRRAVKTSVHPKDAYSIAAGIQICHVYSCHAYVNKTAETQALFWNGTVLRQPLAFPENTYTFFTFYN
jgi:hypothetical protein